MIKNSDKLKWAAVQLKPNMLNKALKNLKFQSIEYLAPTKNETIRSGNFFKSIKRLLFPGYIFVRIDPNTSDVNKVDSTYGVSKLVRRGDKKIALLPDKFIQTIISFQTQSNENRVSFFPGDKIKWVEGPFTGLLGEIFKLDSNGRLKVLFKILDGTIIISTKKVNIEIA